MVVEVLDEKEKREKRKRKEKASAASITKDTERARNEKEIETVERRGRHYRCATDPCVSDPDHSYIFVFVTSCKFVWREAPQSSGGSNLRHDLYLIGRKLSAGGITSADGNQNRTTPTRDLRRRGAFGQRETAVVAVCIGCPR